MIVLTAIQVAACGATARLTVADGTGPRPTLPSPTTSLIPTVHVVKAKGWPPDARPVAAEGTTVAAFARGLDHPRWLYVLPNGDVTLSLPFPAFAASTSGESLSISITRSMTPA
jgi:glucose/arabinose dehydrogenase